MIVTGKQFLVEKPDAWLGGDDWYLTSYQWDEESSISLSPPDGSGNTIWPVVDLNSIYLTDGATINKNYYRQLIVMEDGGTLNIPEQIEIGFQFAVISYTAPITLSTGKVDKTTETIQPNVITVVSKVI